MNQSPVVSDQVVADLLHAIHRAGSVHEREVLEDQLVRSCLPLAERLAARYRNRGADHDDLTAVANLALVNAVRRFEPSRGTFHGFAVATILGEIKKHFRDHCWSVRPPRRIQQMQADITAASERRLQTDSRTPLVADIARDIDASESDVREAMAARGCFSPTSLDQPMRDGGQPLGESLKWEESAYSFIDDWVTVGPLCQELGDDERELLRLRFVEDRTQQEIADIVGVSQMQVSRRLTKLLEQLRSRAAMVDAA